MVSRSQAKVSAQAAYEASEQARKKEHQEKKELAERILSGTEHEQAIRLDAELEEKRARAKKQYQDVDYPRLRQEYDAALAQYNRLSQQQQQTRGRQQRPCRASRPGRRLLGSLRLRRPPAVNLVACRTTSSRGPS